MIWRSSRPSPLSTTLGKWLKPLGRKLLQGRAHDQVRVQVRKSGTEVGLADGHAEERLSPIAAVHGKEGWRLIQLFASALSGTSWASFVELVFERPPNVSHFVKLGWRAPKSFHEGLANAGGLGK